MSDKAKMLAEMLRDTAQSASNTVAGTVSGPVDMISSGLKKAGLHIDKPVGGEKWMAEKGLTREVPPGYPKAIGETAGLLAPTLLANRFPR